MNSPHLPRDLQSLGLPQPVIDAWLTDPVRPMGDAGLASPLWWMDDARLESVCREMAFPQGMVDAFRQAGSALRDKPAWWSLLRLAASAFSQSIRHRRHQATRRPGPPVERWGMLADMYLPMAYLTALPGMIAHHRKMGIDPKITRDTADDLRLWMEEFHAKHGRWGTNDRDGWFCVHLAGYLYALGRLQFEMCNFGLPYVILADDAGPSVALARSDKLVRADGQFASADGGLAQDAPDNWAATYHETDDGWIGHAVGADGVIEHQSRSFPRNQWRVVARPGEPALAVHIPATGRLDPQACLDSFKQAAVFFPRHFPQYQARVFCCCSWLMDPQLASLPTGVSNIARFVKLFHSVPIPDASSNQMFERVFDNQRDLATLPRDNALRRALIAHMERGDLWRSAGGYRLIEWSNAQGQRTLGVGDA